jgi:thiol:disulfide interchange protein
VRLLLVFLTTLTLLGASSLDWSRSYSNSLEQAKAHQKPLMVYLKFPGCGTCRYMDENVFTDSDVKAMLNKHFVIVKLYANDKELPKELQMEMAPVYHFIEPASNERIDTLVGGKNAEKFLELLEEMLEEYTAMKGKKR